MTKQTIKRILYFFVSLQIALITWLDVVFGTIDWHKAWLDGTSCLQRSAPFPFFMGTWCLLKKNETHRFGRTWVYGSLEEAGWCGRDVQRHQRTTTNGQSLATLRRTGEIFLWRWWAGKSDLFLLWWFGHTLLWLWWVGQTLLWRVGRILLWLRWTGLWLLWRLWCALRRVCCEGDEPDCDLDGGNLLGLAFPGDGGDWIFSFSTAWAPLSNFFYLNKK